VPENYLLIGRQTVTKEYYVVLSWDCSVFSLIHLSDTVYCATPPYSNTHPAIFLNINYCAILLILHRYINPQAFTHAQCSWHGAVWSRNLTAIWRPKVSTIRCWLVLHSQADDKA
jgi:hypothetical protein